MDLCDYAKLFIGVPYKWGGSHPAEGYDCSGFIQEVLSSKGIDPKGDQTAHDLFNLFMDRDGLFSVKDIKKNDLLFFGVSRVTHIALAISPYQMIEAGGGGSSTNTIKDAIRDEAMIRIRPITNRSDLMAVLRVPDSLGVDL